MPALARPRLAALALACGLVTACGDDLAGGPGPDAGPDAGPAARCDFTEARDLTNDDIVGGGTPERTEATLATRLRVCGAIDAGHLDVAQAVVDADGYTFTVAAETELLITLGGAGLGDLPLVQLQLYGGPALADLVTDMRLVGAHAAASVRVPAGTYEVAVIASAEANIPASLPYELLITPDDVAARCPTPASGGYAEAQDGAQSDGNDVVLIDRSMSPTTQLTAATTDAPEPTGVTLAPGAAALLTGTSAAVPAAGSYLDKDTFAFTTGPSTDQVTIRVAWPSTTVDLDYHLFVADQLPYVHRSIAAATTGGELQTLAVAPSTTYWLWIGADRVASSALPTTYAATLCGATYAP